MTDFALAMSSLRSRWLNSSLSVLLTAFGVMLALLITQFGHHVQSRLSADGQGIDIVAGAKGSPLQLVLSAIYHVDVPTGNIPYSEAEKWMKHRLVRTAIPLALGDSWQGHRIVGTTPDYLTHYRAEMAEGRVWSKAFEAVAGASVDLDVGDEFAGAHGLMDGGHEHDSERYRVVGVAKPTGTVIDRLILTSLDSVLELHGFEGVDGDADNHDHEHGDHEGEAAHEVEGESHDHEGEAPHDHDGEEADDHKAEEAHDHKAEEAHDHKDEEAHDHDGEEADDHKAEEAHDHEDAHEEKHQTHRASAKRAEVTALLIRTRSPIANINLPRAINSVSALQAANPALEMARLTTMLGIGSRSFAALSALLISIAVLSIFAGLAGSLENRMGDLAVLRAIGFSKRRVFRVIALEGMTIVLSGLILGILMGVGGFTLLARIVTPLATSGAKPALTPQFVVVIGAVMVAGFVAAVLPAVRASRVDVARQLSRNN